MQPTLGMRVLKRAAIDTYHFFGLNKRTLAVPILLVLGLLFDLYWRGLPQVETEVVELALYSLAPTVAFIVALFLWNLWLAPYEEILETAARQTEDRDGAQSLPDFEAWDHVNDYEILQASMLWAEQRPTDSKLTDSASAWMTILMSAVADGELVCKKSDLSNKYIVKREDLKKFAEMKGLSPKFLFPEDR